MHTTQTMTQAGAARAIGMDRGQFSRLVKSGKVSTVETSDGLPLVPLSEVERLKREPRQVGRPKSSA